MDVWRAPGLGLRALAGIVLATLGALIPARAAARLTIAKVLHDEWNTSTAPAHGRPVKK
ncbi:hypothetical protein ACIBF6_32680 [Streptosporangium amethystogenes]|uniref:hypothetical protein n=1 Tax=Streptosporangium amethystogenes TaxID=2002 RepID=UPI00379E2BAF